MNADRTSIVHRILAAIARGAPPVAAPTGSDRGRMHDACAAVDAEVATDLAWRWSIQRAILLDEPFRSRVAIPANGVVAAAKRLVGMDAGERLVGPTADDRRWIMRWADGGHPRSDELRAVCGLPTVGRRAAAIAAGRAIAPAGPSGPSSDGGGDVLTHLLLIHALTDDGADRRHRDLDDHGVEHPGPVRQHGGSDDGSWHHGSHDHGSSDAGCSSGDGGGGDGGGGGGD